MINQTEWLNIINIITNIHHIKPKHSGGTNNTNNLEELTIRDHTKAHYELWIRYGSKKDKMSGDLILSKHKHPSLHIYRMERLKIFNEIYEKYKCQNALYYYIEEARKK